MSIKNTINTEVETALKEAGKFLGDPGYARETAVKKGFADFVTEVDYKVQRFLIKALNDIIPGSNIISEETDSNHYSLSGPTWVLDPVDGTTNLLHGYRHSAISLALYTDGKPLAGWIYNPDSNEMFAAEVGEGAWLNSRKIQASGSSLLGDCLISFGTTPYDRKKAQETFSILERIYMECRDIRRSGSAALDLAYVACGRTDGFFELCLQPWDFAAGMLILEEAGGRVTDREGKKPCAASPGSILATNGLIHEILLGYLR